MDVEAEIRDLKRRGGELEGSFGFLTEQIKGAHRDLHAFQARTEERFDRLDGKVDRLDGKGDRIEQDVRGLRRDLPGIIGDALRTASRERPAKPKA